MSRPEDKGFLPAFLSVLFLAAALVFFGAMSAKSQTSQGSVSFSPSSVKNGVAYTYGLTGGVPNAATRLWVDNWLDNNPDPNNFQDFGSWLTTDANGNIPTQSKALNCDSYNTLTPGQSVAVGNHVLHQRVHVAYTVNGAPAGQSNDGTQDKDCTTGGATPPPNATTTTSTPPYASTCGRGSLFAHTVNVLVPFYSFGTTPDTFDLIFPANSQISSSPYFDWGYGGLEEYFQSDSVSMTALDPLPPGLTLNSHTVNYPAPNMNSDGINSKIQDYINKDLQKGFPPLTRYYIGGMPTVQGKTTVRLQAKSATCTETETFNFIIKAPEPPPGPAYSAPDILLPAPTSTNGLISFVKTLFYNDPAPDGAQMLGDMTTWGKKGDKFVISGEYGGSFSGSSLNTQTHNGGGGLWTIAEDGSKIVERDAAIDAGSGSDQIYQHGHRHTSFAINLEWASGGFVMENASWGSCLSANAAINYCTQPGPGANQAVYYKQGADGYPVVAGKSGNKQDNPTGLTVFKNIVVSRNTGETYSLPRWTDLGGADTTISGISFGNNLIDGKGEVYSMTSDGGMEDTGNNLLDSGYAGFTYAWDWSGGFPPRMAVWERGTQVPNAPNGTTSQPDKIKVYKLSSDNIVLDKTITSVPPNYVYPVYNIAAPIVQFSIWGDYIVNINPVNRGLIDIWKNGQKLDTVQMPSFGSNSWVSGGVANASNIAVSKGGYMAVVIRNAPRQATAFLYKLDVPPSGGATPAPPSNNPPGGGTPPAGGTPPTLGSGTCYAQYPDNIQLRSLCEQIEALKKQVCAAKPTLSVCSGLK